MPLHKLPTNSKNDLLPLSNRTSRQARKVTQITRVKKGVRIIFGYQQAGQDIIRLRRFVCESSDGLDMKMTANKPQL
jgi:hypothetical protein